MICDAIEGYKGDHLFHILVDGFDHITNKDGMCEIKVSFSQPGWFHRTKVE
jgi:hypothetical protein